MHKMHLMTRKSLILMALIGLLGVGVTRRKRST